MVNLDEVALVLERCSHFLGAKGERGSYAEVWQHAAQWFLLQVSTEQIMLSSANFFMRKTLHTTLAILLTPFVLSPWFESAPLSYLDLGWHLGDKCNR